MSLKLYSCPGSCSSAVHIALREAGVAFETVAVDLRSRKAADGHTIDEINSKGYVPVLQFDDGQRLTEIPAIMIYIAGLAPEKSLAPGPLHRILEWLCFISSEVHKSFGPLFSPALGDEAKAEFARRLQRRLSWIDAQLQGRSYLLGDTFSVADCYLFVVAGWSARVKIDLSGLPNLTAYLARVARRPAVEAALRADGLLG